MFKGIWILHPSRFHFPDFFYVLPNSVMCMLNWRFIFSNNRSYLQIVGICPVWWQSTYCERLRKWVVMFGYNHLVQAVF